MLSSIGYQFSKKMFEVLLIGEFTIQTMPLANNVHCCLMYRKFDGNETQCHSVWNDVMYLCNTSRAGCPFSKTRFGVYIQFVHWSGMTTKPSHIYTKGFPNRKLQK